VFTDCQAGFYTCHSEQGAVHPVGSLRCATGIGAIHVKALSKIRHILNMDAD